MAKYERLITGDFDEVLRSCNDVILGGSISATLEDGSDYASGAVRVAVRVYERYSHFGGNRVSLNLTLVGEGNSLFLLRHHGRRQPGDVFQGQHRRRRGFPRHAHPRT